MMKPDPMPQPVLMNTVALRAVSMALRAGKVLASCASRPRSACGKGPAADGADGADGAGGAGGAAPICAAPLAALAGGTGVAGEVACPRRTYQASAMLSIAVRASALQPKPLSGSSSCAAPERFAISSCCWANFAK